MTDTVHLDWDLLYQGIGQWQLLTHLPIGHNHLGKGTAKGTPAIIERPTFGHHFRSIYQLPHVPLGQLGVLRCVCLHHVES